jgi:hypothetical protein
LAASASHHPVDHAAGAAEFKAGAALRDRHHVVIQARRVGRVDFQFTQRCLAAPFHGGEVEEVQPHRLAQFPCRVLAHEHRRDRRLHRVGPGESAQKRSRFALFGGNGQG